MRKTSDKVKKKKPRSGNPFEWICCRDLSLNFSSGESNELFCPSRGSGSIATRRRKKGEEAKTQTADIGLADPRGKLFIDTFCSECKLGYMGKRKTDKGIVKTTWGPLDILDGKQNETTLETFWNQTTRDAKINNKEPLLFFRRNNRTACVVMYQSIYQKCVHLFGIPPDGILNIDFKDYDLVILNMKTFLNWVNMKELCHEIDKEKTNSKEAKQNTTEKEE